jgi:hypothetical protein
MKTLLKAAVMLTLVLGGCGDAGAVDTGFGGFNGSGGKGGTDTGTDLVAECDFETCQTAGDGTETCLRWTEFEVDPGQTEYTLCTRGNAAYIDNWPGFPFAQDTCHRATAVYYEGTSTGFVTCDENTISITVHR